METKMNFKPIMWCLIFMLVSGLLIAFIQNALIVTPISKSEDNADYIVHNGVRYSTKAYKNSVIVKLKEGLTDEEIDKVLSPFGEYKWLNDKKKSVFSVRFREKDIDDAIKRLKSVPQVLYLERNGPIFLN